MTDHSKIAAKILITISKLAEKPLEAISPETHLIGDGSVLDSMKLVELCLELEDIATDLGFDFDWTSENAMSKSRGMFRSAASLTEQFLAQLEGRS
jgi:acyl carrier protein